MFNVLEFFAGIGGAARAFEGIGNVVAAFDINENAAEVYSANFEHPYFVKSVEDVSTDELRSLDADTWWLSAPCQPFTRRGLQLDDQDPRASALQALIKLLAKNPPQNLCLENVVGFEQSNMRNELARVLEQNQFHFTEVQFCSTELGIPNQRPRYYLFASQREFDERDLTEITTFHPGSIERYLDENLDQSLWLEEELVQKHLDGLNIIGADSTTSNCFTSAYGKSITKCGSYLRGDDRSVRRFSPDEIAKMLGFWGPELDTPFKLPSTLSYRQQWKLLGNSISVFVVRELLVQFSIAVSGVS